MYFLIFFISRTSSFFKNGYIFKFVSLKNLKKETDKTIYIYIYIYIYFLKCCITFLF